MSGAKLEANGDVIPTSDMVMGGDCHHSIKIEQKWHVECWRDGELIWSDAFVNLVVTTGRNKYLDATLKTGLSSPTWYVGLITGPGAGNTYVAADTMASHAGWAESSAYAGSTRPAFTPGSIASGSVDNSASKASFNINTTATIAGAFLVDQNTTGGSTGTLLGEGNFTGGDRAVQNGDTLNVTMTASIT